eukprot:CAMPEP_0196253834 /NCGR_PEP_ID=MMETSP0913-20130531/52631_1 /TAXON_ID=49265 /ORGANISM="Thalassiosira rotula, Strain GSO102" /LENGTH=37 /DNA_ID= /DNA_START= /DNA_END= /DNA_ORIENTATION=
MSCRTHLKGGCKSAGDGPTKDQIFESKGPKHNIGTNN